jgi:hypothetical protein
MAEEREQVTSSELTRWLAFGVALLIGLGLYVAFGSEVEPVARPAVLEEGS